MTLLLGWGLVGLDLLVLLVYCVCVFYLGSLRLLLLLLFVWFCVFMYSFELLGFMLVLGCLFYLTFGFDWVVVLIVWLLSDYLCLL